MSNALPTVLFFPEGYSGHFFYGRCGLDLTVLGAQAVEQNDCMYMGGEGDIEFDIGLCRASDGREALVPAVLLTGGSLARLNTSAAIEELSLGVPCPSAAAGGAGGAAPAQLPSALHFEPTGMYEGPQAEADAAKFFPAVVASAVAQKGAAVAGDFLIVRGHMELRNCLWRESSTSTPTPAPPPPDSVAALLKRRYNTREGAAAAAAAKAVVRVVEEELEEDEQQQQQQQQQQKPPHVICSGAHGWETAIPAAGGAPPPSCSGHSH